MSKFLQKSNDAYNFYKSKNAQKRFNDELVQKTGHYQKNSILKQILRKGTNFGMLKQMHLSMHLEVQKCI